MEVEEQKALPSLISATKSCSVRTVSGSSSRFTVPHRFEDVFVELLRDIDVVADESHPVLLHALLEEDFPSTLRDCIRID